MSLLYTTKNITKPHHDITHYATTFLHFLGIFTLVSFHSFPLPPDQITFLFLVSISLLGQRTLILLYSILWTENQSLMIDRNIY